MKKFDNFCKALNNLEDMGKYNPPYDNVVLAGLVSLYEICFEQAWKAMKEVMEYEGVGTSATGSPRSIIKEAYKLHMIDDESGWLEALVARNAASHVYNQNTALEIVKKTKESFKPLFYELKGSIEKNWMH